MSIEYSIPLLASSDPINGASQIDKKGSRFTVVYSRPIIVPSKAKYCWITVEGSTIIFNTPNILDGVNNTMKIIYNNGINPEQIFNIEIPPGLYDLDHLNATIQQQLSNYNAPQTDGITLLPDTATQKVVIKFRQYFQVDLTAEDSLAEILGFTDPKIVPDTPAVIDNEYVTANEIAKFNSILYYLVHSDLVAGHGMRINDIYADIIQQVPINVEAGSQINYEPLNLQKIPCPNLIGQSIREFHFWITDNRNQFVDTLGEFWSTRLNINYVM